MNTQRQHGDIFAKARDGRKPQAVEAMHKLKVKRSEDDLPVLRRTPRFKDHAKTCLVPLPQAAIV